MQSKTNTEVFAMNIYAYIHIHIYWLSHVPIYIIQIHTDTVYRVTLTDIWNMSSVTVLCCCQSWGVKHGGAINHKQGMQDNQTNADNTGLSCPSCQGKATPSGMHPRYHHADWLIYAIVHFIPSHPFMPLFIIHITILSLQPVELFCLTFDGLSVTNDNHIPTMLGEYHGASGVIYFTIFIFMKDNYIPEVMP